MLGADAGYWDFFADRDVPGRLPVWGFATVTRSGVARLPVRERLYGYGPLASHATLVLDRIGAAWRAFMPTARTLTALDRRRGGGDAALGAYCEAVSGRADPAVGVLIVP